MKILGRIKWVKMSDGAKTVLQTSSCRMTIRINLLLPLVLNFTNIFGTKAEQLLRKYFFMIFAATEFGKLVPKYGTEHKSCSLKYAGKFKCKCWQNITASFAPFVLCWCHFELCKLVGEIGGRWQHGS